MKLFEATLTFWCLFAASLLKFFNWLFTLVANIITVLLFVVLFVGVWHGISILPLFWQHLCLISIICLGTSSFVSIVTLAIWKPDRFSKIFK